MKSTVQFETVITTVDTETECVEHSVSVEANYYPGSPAVFYERNGDPGHPEEPDEVEVLKVTRKDNNEELDWDSLPESVKEKLEEEVRDQVHGTKEYNDEAKAERDSERREMERDRAEDR